MVRLTFSPVVVVVLLSMSSAITAQTTQVIPAADLQTDFAILRQAYETLHPGLYRYSTKREMDRKFDVLRREFQHDLTLQEAFLAFSRFSAQVRCGHTQTNPFNQKKAILTALFQGQNRVPFYFRWLDGQMIVTRDFTGTQQLPAGTEVLSINGTPAREILSRLMSISRADGSNDAKRIANLEVTGDSIYETFDLYFPMFFPLKDRGLTLRARRPGDKTPQPLTVVALTDQERIAPIEAREASRNGGDQALFDWNYLEDGSAYLRMYSWALYNSEWDWKTWLNQHLDEAAERSAPALILDLRGNEGGNDVGNEILKHLIDADLRLATLHRLVRYREVPAALAPYLDTWDPSFKNWGASAVELDHPWTTAPAAHFFALKRYDDDAAGGDVIRPAGKRFQGKVFVLIDAANSSATFQFAQIMQQNHLGTLIGQPTGGNLRGINGGAFFFLRLPKSGIELDLPLIGTFPTSAQADRGLTPDIPVTTTIDDIVAGRDPELAKVRQLLAR